MPKISPARKEERRQQILHAAIACFAKRGFHETTIQDICAEAGLSTGAVYSYYRSKDAIIAALAEQGRRVSVERSKNSADVPPEAGLESYLREFQTAGMTKFNQFDLRVWADAVGNRPLREIYLRSRADAIKALTPLVGRPPPGRDWTRKFWRSLSWPSSWGAKPAERFSPRPKSCPSSTPFSRCLRRRVRSGAVERRPSRISEFSDGRGLHRSCHGGLAPHDCRNRRGPGTRRGRPARARPRGWGAIPRRKSTPGLKPRSGPPRFSQAMPAGSGPRQLSSRASRRSARTCDGRASSDRRSGRDTRSRRRTPARNRRDSRNSRRQAPGRRPVVVVVIVAGIEAIEPVAESERDSHLRGRGAGEGERAGSEHESAESGLREFLHPATPFTPKKDPARPGEGRAGEERTPDSSAAPRP